MSYAIAHMIYGMPLHNNKDDPNHSHGLQELLDDQEGGYIQHYSGGGTDVPSAFGIELSEFNEACHHVELKDIVVVPSNEVRAKFHKLLEKQPSKIKEEIAKFGPPRVFLLWSTS